MRVSYCCCCWKVHVRGRNFDGYLCLETIRPEINIDDALSDSTRSTPLELPSRRMPASIFVNFSQQTSYACTSFSKTHPSMLGTTLHVVYHNIGSPIKRFPAPRVLSHSYGHHLAWRCRPCWIMTIVLIGWQLHVETANTSKSRHQSRPMHALGTCSPQNLGLTLLAVDACSPCFSGTPPLVPLISGGPRTRPGGPRA
jgi:hypothetical protein